MISVVKMFICKKLSLNGIQIAGSKICIVYPIKRFFTIHELTLTEIK